MREQSIPTIAPHPEDALDRVRAGTASARELDEIEAHAADCPSCEEELATILARREPNVPSAANDDAAIARAVAIGLAAYDAQVAPLPEPNRRRGVPAIAIAVVAGLFVTTAAAAAVYFGVREEPALAPQVEPAPPVSTPSPPRETPPVARTAEPAPIDLPMVDVSIEPPPAVEPTRPRPRIHDAPALDAAALLAAATEARRTGDLPRATQLYGELQRRFSGSREANVSRIALGRVLLDELARPADALAQFDGYLRSQRSGTLAEEARVGRATALDRLGRDADAERAWRELLELHPASPHAERARRRLGEDRK